MLYSMNTDKRTQFIKNVLKNEGDKLDLTKLANYTGIDWFLLKDLVEGANIELSESRVEILEMRLLNRGYQQFYK
ncbi:MAG: hypothetical protein ACRDDY_04765 [Clostridium sp.]|uniref:hypothetical protein n=1 Tax=Clostridium sp. TaxID=1506 RepID=UPI003EE6CDEE